MLPEQELRKRVREGYYKVGNHLVFNSGNRFFPYLTNGKSYIIVDFNELAKNMLTLTYVTIIDDNGE